MKKSTFIISVIVALIIGLVGGYFIKDYVGASADMMPCILTGQITTKDAQNKPVGIAGATVTAKIKNGGTFTSNPTGKNGIYTLQLPQKVMTLTTVASGYEDQSKPLNLTSKCVSRVDFNMIKIQPATVTGLVTDDSKEAQPIAGAKLVLQYYATTPPSSCIVVAPPPAIATTTAQGLYIFQYMPGTYYLSANADGYECSGRKVILTRGQTTTANFTLTSTIPEPVVKPPPPQ